MLTILSPLLLALSPQQPVELATRVFPTQQFTPAERTVAAPPWGSLLQRRPELGHTLLLEGGESRIDGSFIAGLVEALETEAINDERLVVMPSEANLTAFGDPATLDRIDGHLTQLLAVVGRDIRLECCVWDVPETDAPDTVLDPDAFTAFVGDRTPVWRSLATTRSDRVVALDNMTWTDYVFGVDAEVAHNAHVFYPIRSAFGSGGHVLAAAHSLIGDDGFAVHMQFACSDVRDDLRPVQTGIPQAPNVQIPALNGFYGNCSARIANGGALAVALRGQSETGGNMIVTLRATAKPRPDSIYRERSLALPISALTTRSSTRRAQLMLPDADRHPSQTDFEQHAAFGHLDADALRSLVEGLLEPHEDDGDRRVVVASGFLFVNGPKAALPEIETLLGAMQDRIVQNAELWHTASTHLTPTANGEAVGPTLHELRAPTLIGRELTLVRLQETNIVSGLQAHIAQEAGLLTPTMQLQQAGAWLRAYVLPTAAGHHVDMELLTAISPPASIANIVPTGGTMMLGSVTTTTHGHQGIASEDGDLQHGSGPRVSIGNRTYRTRLTTRIR